MVKLFSSLQLLKKGCWAPLTHVKAVPVLGLLFSRLQCWRWDCPVFESADLHSSCFHTKYCRASGGFFLAYKCEHHLAVLSSVRLDRLRHPGLLQPGRDFGGAKFVRSEEAGLYPKARQDGFPRARCTAGCRTVISPEGIRPGLAGIKRINKVSFPVCRVEPLLCLLERFEALPEGPIPHLDVEAWCRRARTAAAGCREARVSACSGSASACYLNAFSFSCQRASALLSASAACALHPR